MNLVTEVNWITSYYLSLIELQQIMRYAHYVEISNGSRYYSGCCPDTAIENGEMLVYTDTNCLYLCPDDNHNVFAETQGDGTCKIIGDNFFAIIYK